MGVFTILFLLCLWKQGTPQQFLKQISKLSFQLNVQIYSLLGQTEGEKKAFFGGCKKGGANCEITDVIRDEKVSPFVKFELILPFLCFLLYPLRNKHCRTWSSMINLWIDSRTCEKQRILLIARLRPNNYLELSEENALRNMMLSH